LFPYTTLFRSTCTRSLPPKGSCEVSLQFETSQKGDYELDVLFKYTNLVEQDVRPLKLQLLAGNPASLVFKDDINSFFFGSKVGSNQVPVVERNDPITYEQIIEITNTGD